MATKCRGHNINSHNKWLFEGGRITIWTKEENKKFERALAIFDEKTPEPDRWYKVASMLPGKSVVDVMRHYEELIEDVTDIEAGLVPIPGYPTSTTFTLDYCQGLTNPSSSSVSLSSRPPPPDHDRKKGVPWTQDEHRRFLLGLEKHGKGDWRNISRNFVFSKTPTQVASHAQKYFLRQNSGGKDKRRPSIHDITTANVVTDSEQKPKFLINQSPSFPPSLQKSINIMPKMLLNWSSHFDAHAHHGRQNQYSAMNQGAYVGSN